MSLLWQVLQFAADRHRDQRRKGLSHPPYINHPIEVAATLWQVGGVRDWQLLAAALLHDTVEDTGTSPDEIEDLFGREVRDLVMEVTDDKLLPKDERKRLQVEHAPQLSPSARLLKLADKICNLRDISTDPPEGWSAERIDAYFTWAGRVVDAIRGTNPALEAEFDRLLARRP